MESYVEVYQLINSLVKDVQKLLSSLNIPYSCSLVLSILLLLRGAMNIKDLMELSGYTKSTVVTCLNMLSNMYLVSRVRNGRSYVYSARVDIPEVLIEKQKNLLSNEIEPLCINIEKVLASLDSKHEISVRLKTLNMKLKTIAERIRQTIEKLP